MVLTLGLLSRLLRYSFRKISAGRDKYSPVECPSAGLPFAWAGSRFYYAMMATDTRAGLCRFIVHYTTVCYSWPVTACGFPAIVT